MEYWVIIDKEQRGPMGLEELKELPLAPDTPVWYKGLTDWTTVAAIPELASILKAGATTPGEGIPAAAGIIAVPAGSIPPGYVPIMPVSPDRVRKAPPSYMWLSILLTIFGTIFIGIVAIFFSWRVTVNRKRADAPKAYRASERAALFNILNIVFTLISLPFGMVMEMGGFSLF